MDNLAKTFCGVDNFQLPFYLLLEYSFNSTIPHLSQCSQDSFLTLIPCIFLFLFAPLVFHSLYTSDNGSLEVYSPISARILISVLLSFYAGYQLFFGIIGGHNNVPFNFIFLVPRILQYLTLCAVLVMLVACKKRGVITSGVLFNFWFLMAVCKFPEFRWRVSSFLHAEEFDDWMSFSLFILFYILILLQLLLSCFADTPEENCPEEYCSFLNQITFSWFNKLAVKGSKQPLQVSDLWKLKNRDKSSVLVPRFNAHFLPALKGYSLVDDAKGLPSVIWSLFKTFKWSFIGGMLLKLVFDLLQFVSPQVLKMLISFIEDKRSPMWIGVSISLLMFFVALFQSFVLHQYFHMMFTAGMNIRSVLTSAIYTKALCLSNSARNNRTVGEIVNLMSVDIQRFQDMASFIMLFWSAPLQIVLSIYFLWRLLGVSVFAGIFVLIGMIPLNALLACRMRSAQVKQMKYKDERLKLMSEILNGMKILKFYGWENSMKKMVLAIRQKELKVLRRLAYYNAAISLSWSCAPFLVTVVTFGVFVNISSSNILTPQVTFVGLALFNILRFPMTVLSMLFSQAVQCAVSNRRVKSFLGDDEIENYVLKGNSSSSAMIIKNGNFSWDTGELTLRNINLNIKPGQLVAVVGRVGSGKSSLLSAFLGKF
uniref:ABC transmembrane type-1 domain-containing protein n=1 Tax=Syphacia muris TaxID=451379 RepID=A0A0N5AB16_9BILA